MTEENLKTKKNKTWKKWEIIYLISCLVVITICFIFSPDKSILSFITSLFGVTTVFLLAKGFVFAPITDFIYNILYSAVSIVMCYYGEALIYIFIMMPITISALVSWIKNKNSDDNTVKVNVISKKEWLYLVFATIGATIGFYFLLKVLNTRELIISTISLISSMLGGYLIFRRSAYYAIPFIINDVILIILWGLSIFEFGLMYLPNVLSFFVFLFNDSYGFVRWKKSEKSLKEENSKQ